MTSITAYIVWSVFFKHEKMYVTAEGWEERLETHPRIYFTRESLNDIRKRCQTDLKQLFDEMKAYADNLKGEIIYNGWAASRRLQMYAFLYAVTGEEIYAKYAENYMEWFRAVKDDIDDFELGMGIEAVAEGIDWCYDYLGPQKVSKYGRALVDMCDRMLYKEWRHSDFNNHVYIEHLRILYAAIALRGEDALAEKADEYLNFSEDLLKNHLIPATNLVSSGSGGWHEGMGYEKMTMPYLAMAIEAWRVYFGENLFPMAEGLRLVPLWNIYCLRPDGRYVRIHDSKMTKPDALTRAYMLLLAARYQDGYAQWMAYQYQYSHRIEDHENVYKIFDLMWDPLIEPKPPETLPRDRFFNGLGWLIARSDWGPDAVYAVFECGPYYGGHQHADQGNFIIFGRGGYLAVDSGYYDRWGSEHHMNYFRRTIAHNTILIYDPEEQFRTSSGRILSNDGGQLVVPGDVARYWTDEIPKPGKILDYALEDKYVFALGNMTNAYNRSKASEVLRYFVYVKPDIFVIYDIVKLNPERADLLTVKWLLHTINEPKLLNCEITVQHNNATLLVDVLKPTKFEIHKIGGANYEFFVDGKNYPPFKRDEEAGNWRVELEFTGEDKNIEFLNVLRVTESGATLSKPTLIEDKNYRCVEIPTNKGLLMILLNAHPGKSVNVTIPLDGNYIIKPDYMLRQGIAEIFEEDGAYMLKATLKNCLVIELIKT